MAYAEIFAEFPPELRLPVARLVDMLRDELHISRTDFEELKAIVRDLAQVQQRTEVRVGSLKGAVQRLAEAQQRTELRVEELGGAVQQLAEQHRLFRYSFGSQPGGLGARWDLQTEEAFRQGMREILREVGFTAEHFLNYDAAGEVFGHPDQVELDVVIQNGKVLGRIDI